MTVDAPTTGQDLRPEVAAPLRSALVELAALVPTDLATDEDIAAYRHAAVTRATAPDDLCARFGLERHEPRPDLTVLRATETPTMRVVFAHGGGLVAGNRFDGAHVLARHAADLGLEIWTVEYPLVPEASFADAAEAVVDAVAAAADGLPVVLAGQSAGGGLAAAAALACRDRGLDLAGVLLVCPMLDAQDTASARQFDGDPLWSPLSNRTAWDRALAGTNAVAPGDRDDLAGLPPVYLDSGTAEVFRDSITRFAGRLWAAGVAAELHVWSGGYHGFDTVVEDAAVSRESHRARREWLRRVRDSGL